MSGRQTTQLTTIFVSAVESCGTPGGHSQRAIRRLTNRSHSRRSRLADSLGKQQLRSHNYRKDESPMPLCQLPNHRHLEADGLLARL